MTKNGRGQKPTPKELRALRRGSAGEQIDARYNAAEAVRWALGRIPRPELNYADCEPVLQMGELLDVLLSSQAAATTILGTLKDIRSRYGEFGLIVFLDNLLEILEEVAAEHRPPNQQEQREAQTARKRREQEQAAEN